MSERPGSATAPHKWSRDAAIARARRVVVRFTHPTKTHSLLSPPLSRSKSAKNSG